MKLSNLILLLFFTLSITAQTNLPSKRLDSLPNTIENQFLKILKKGNSWHEFKMVKKTEFIRFQKNILDSVSTIKKDVIDKKNTIASQKTTIDSLNEDITKLKTDLSVALDKEDNISLLGIPVKKALYNTVLFSIILALLIALFFFIFKFKNSNLITNNAKKELLQVEEELDIYRKKSIEKEQKLRRQLQDEINKQRGV